MNPCGKGAQLVNLAGGFLVGLGLVGLLNGWHLAAVLPLIGVGAALTVISFWPNNRRRHIHEWTPWRQWGITYQQRRCLACGLRKIKSQ